jgi:hypothetical protein
MGSSCSITFVAKDLNIVQSRTHDRFEVALLAQFISLMYAEKEL